MHLQYVLYGHGSCNFKTWVWGSSIFTDKGGGAECLLLRAGEKKLYRWGWGAESVRCEGGAQNRYGIGLGNRIFTDEGGEQNLYGWWSRTFTDEGGEQNLWGWGSSAITPNLISIWSWEMALVWNPVGLQFKLTIETFVSRFNLHCQKEFKLSTSFISLFS